MDNRIQLNTGYSNGIRTPGKITPPSGPGPLTALVEFSVGRPRPLAFIIKLRIFNGHVWPEAIQTARFSIADFVIYEYSIDDAVAVVISVEIRVRARVVKPPRVSM